VTLTYEEYERYGMSEVMKLMNQVWKESVTLLRKYGTPAMQLAYMPPAKPCECAPADREWWCACCNGFPVQRALLGEEIGRLRDALEKIEGGDGCYTPSYGDSCDMGCARVAREALASPQPSPAPTKEAKT